MIIAHVLLSVTTGIDVATANRTTMETRGIHWNDRNARRVNPGDAVNRL